MNTVQCSIQYIESCSKLCVSSHVLLWCYRNSRGTRVLGAKIQWAFEKVIHNKQYFHNNLCKVTVQDITYSSGLWKDHSSSGATPLWMDRTTQTPGKTRPGHIATFNCLRPSLLMAGRAYRVAGHCKWGPSTTWSTPRSFSVLPGCAARPLLSSPFIILRSAGSFYSLPVSFHSYGNQDPSTSQEQMWLPLFCLPDEFCGSRNSCFCTWGKDSTVPTLSCSTGGLVAVFTGVQPTQMAPFPKKEKNVVVWYSPSSAFLCPWNGENSFFMYCSLLPKTHCWGNLKGCILEIIPFQFTVSKVVCEMVLYWNR